MKLIPICITLLSPFFNYSKVTNRGCITSNFIGDLALTYALNRVLKTHNFYEEVKLQPNYMELQNLPYIFTIGKPVRTQMTSIYMRNTLFTVDGYPDLEAIENSGRNLFKNFWKVQGIKPASIFSSYLITTTAFVNQLKDKLPLAIRLGTSRECLALLEINTEPDENDIWLNGYTLKNVFEDRSRIALELMKDRGYQIEFKLQNYIIFKGLTSQDVETIFKGIK